MSKKAKRRIKAAKISLISLVPRGANQVASLFKGDDVVEMQAVAKLGSEGYLTALVYVPDAVDSQGDTASVEAIKQMAHDFISNMEDNGIDVMHDCSPTGAERARICETFIVQKGDARFQGIKDTNGDPIDPTGAWGVIIKIDDPELRKLYESGEWVGVSMFGSASVEPLTKSTPKETKMDPDKMAELLEKFGAKLSSEIVDGLAKAITPSDPAPPADPAPQAVEFEGDFSNPEDVAKHAERVLFASLDMSNPQDIAKWQAHLAKKEEAQPAPADENADEIAKLQKQIDRLRGASAEGGEPVRKSTPKTMAEKLAAGQARAAQLKKAGVF